MSEDKKRKEHVIELAKNYLGWADQEKKQRPKDAPAAMLGERILLRQQPPETETIGGLKIPNTSKVRPYRGQLIGAGAAACDKLYDACVELGDEVWWGKFTGVVEEWYHEIVEGDKGCKHDWAFIGGIEVEDSEARYCAVCGAVMVREPMVVANVNDIVANVDLQLRIEAGLVRRYLAKTPEGKTRFVDERVDESETTTWDIEPEQQNIKAVK